jgi:hypothetical protein
MKPAPSIPNDYLHCRCHLGASAEVNSVLVRGDDIEATVYPDCPFHAQLVRLAGNGVKYSLNGLEMPDGEKKAIMMKMEPDADG